jgi:hypothetical protein
VGHEKIRVPVAIGFSWSLQLAWSQSVKVRRSSRVGIGFTGGDGFVNNSKPSNKAQRMQKAWVLFLISLIPPGWAADLEASRAGRQAAATNAIANLPLKERCIEILRTGMWDGAKWIKVHAGEDLARLDYLEGVYDYYKHELALHGNEPEYRVGLWRVLAQAATHDADRELWLGKIRAACVDAQGPDRGRATEALGRLAYKPNAREEEALLTMSQGGEPELAVLAKWVLANSGRTSDVEGLAAMLGHSNSDIRANAAYALRFSPRLNPNIFEQLTTALAKEPGTSGARVYLVTAAFVHAPTREKARYRTMVVDYLGSELARDRYEACAGMGKAGTVRDIPVLEKLLADPELDVRVSAADAILRIGRRGNFKVYSSKAAAE